MSYTTRLTVPLITADDVANVLAALPDGASTLVKIPVTDTAEKVAPIAWKHVQDSLLRYEYVRDITSITLDPAKKVWTVDLAISGD